ncbi:(R)-mandelonitrile lyase-like [Vitis vinifera]|uniref:(R)-mandelonitrile lyase-like n=1 Tax=Vitis vinifera TaxID=29760 RepID=A0A438JZT9_VITVI|nr:(R)-mandelonitrile lyase-like [Vitis vinifera]
MPWEPRLVGSTFDSSGRRHTAADLLGYAKATNIRVAVHASVERILLAPTSALSGSKQSAIGVVYRDRIGRYHHAMVRENGEVILSAGAIGTPQLLLLSGIGPRSYLSSWGIPVVHHLPYVGQFLYDNPRNGISIVSPIPLEHSLIQVVGITNLGAYIEAASNVIPFASPARSVFIRTPSSPLYLTVATLMEKIIGPLSSGSLQLASTDIKWHAQGWDVLRSRSMEEFKFREWFGGQDFRFVGPALPVNQSNDAQMAEFCHRTVSTIWHYHGGCIVGKVVDSDHQVLGIDALRVVDGSTFNVSPGTNPQATLMMLGRYIGIKITKERMR